MRLRLSACGCFAARFGLQGSERDLAMFEVVYETRNEGSTPDDGTLPKTSLVLETKFEKEAEADAAMHGFQSPYPEKWDEPAKAMCFARDPKEGKWHIWYRRPAS